MREGYRFFRCPDAIVSEFKIIVFDSKGTPFLPLTQFYHYELGRISESSVISYLNVLMPYFHWLECNSNFQGTRIAWDKQPDIIRVAINDYLRQVMKCKVRNWSSFELVRETSKSPSTVNRFLAALKAFYKSMKRINQYAFENPLIDSAALNTDFIELKQGYRPGRPRMPASAGTELPIGSSFKHQSDSYYKMVHNEWTPIIIDDPALPSQVFNAAKKANLQLRDQIIIRMLFETGARASEVIEVTIGDYRKRRSIREISTFNKGSNGRRTKFLLFSNDTYILLMRYLRNERVLHDRSGVQYDQLPDEAPIFITITGSSYSYPAWYAQWRKAIQTIGFKLNPHKTRHWYVTNVMRTIYETTVDESEVIVRIREFVRYMKWRSKETLSTYEHYFDEKKQLDLIDLVHTNMQQAEKQFVENGARINLRSIESNESINNILEADSEISEFFEGLV